jgi:hypothetical protein
MPRSLPVLLALAALCAAATGAAASVSGIPLVHRGQTVRLAGAPGGTPACLPAVVYADGRTVDGPIKNAVLGKVSWAIRIPSNAAYGLAHWSVRCGPTWQQGGTWRVVAAAIPPPAVLVAGNGFSQRPDQADPGSKVSYGVFLRNTSLKRDAKNVLVLVGFVDAKGRLLGSTTKTLPLVAAGQTFAYGGSASLGSRAAVKKLEVTVRVRAGAAAATRPQTHVTNVTVVADQQDPAWVGEVDGEITNDASTQTMSSAQLSLVVLDAKGAIVGGGTTAVSSPLPAGARMVFAARGGLASIPTSRAASAVVSVLPQYQAG